MHAAKLAAIDAQHAVQAHPYEWAMGPEAFAQAPEGWTPLSGDPGGRGRLLGATTKAD